MVSFVLNFIVTFDCLRVDVSKLKLSKYLEVFSYVAAFLFLFQFLDIKSFFVLESFLLFIWISLLYTVLGYVDLYLVDHRSHEKLLFVRSLGYNALWVVLKGILLAFLRYGVLSSILFCYLITNFYDGNLFGVVSYILLTHFLLTALFTCFFILLYRSFLRPGVLLIILLPLVLPWLVCFHTYLITGYLYHFLFFLLVLVYVLMVLFNMYSISKLYSS
uniref:Heme ABC transporter permease n=1 Tax=Ophirina amphinema TaxID=2108040 RepID=A0A348AYV1_9EUKA|nr:heme ABC transporter permease [Ophirina amphinema]